jgi:hypothetical protein
MPWVILLRDTQKQGLVQNTPSIYTGGNTNTANFLKHFNASQSLSNVVACLDGIKSHSAESGKKYVIHQIPETFQIAVRFDQ